MSLHPASLLGLPSGFPDMGNDLGFFRYLLVALAVLWAYAVLRGRRRHVVLCGLLFATVAIGFWVMALARPYGLLTDADATRWSAQAGVAGSESFLAGEVAADRPWPSLRAALPADVLIALPSLMPLLLVPALALGLLLGREPDAAVAVSLWLAFSTGELDATNGFGCIPGAFVHPEAALAVLLAVAVHMLLSRADRSAWGWPRALLLLGAAWALSGSGAPRAPIDRLFAMTLDQGVWLALGIIGLWRSATGSARALVMAGACGLWFPGDGWSAHVLLRIGLLLAAAGPVKELAVRLAAALPELASRRSVAPQRLGLALLLLASVPGSFLVWWDPVRLDPVFKESLEPISGKLTGAMAWIARETPPDAVLMASADYAPAIAVLGRRRVLQAPTLLAAEDDERRSRLARHVLLGPDPGLLLARYGLRYLFVAPGDFRSIGLPSMDALDGRPWLKRRDSGSGSFRVYEIVALP